MTVNTAFNVNMEFASIAAATAAINGNTTLPSDVKTAVTTSLALLPAPSPRQFVYASVVGTQFADSSQGSNYTVITKLIARI